MKKLLHNLTKVTFVILFFLFAYPLNAYAQIEAGEGVGTLVTGNIDNLNPCNAPGAENTVGCQVQNLQIGGVVGQVVQFIFVIAVILALGFLVYGGIKWITSGGDKSNVETARGTIIAAIIGLIIVFLAYVILNLIINFLTGNDLGTLSVPSIQQLSNSSGGTDCTGYTSVQVTRLENAGGHCL